MSNDLINDLRGNFDAYPEILAAADEIERLRAENADLRLSAAVACHNWCPHAECMGDPGQCVAHGVSFDE